jgi:hypothetical protein
MILDLESAFDAFDRRHDEADEDAGEDRRLTRLSHCGRLGSGHTIERLHLRSEYSLHAEYECIDDARTEQWRCDALVERHESFSAHRV